MDRETPAPCGSRSSQIENLSTPARSEGARGYIRLCTQPLPSLQEHKMTTTLRMRRRAPEPAPDQSLAVDRLDGAGQIAGRGLLMRLRRGPRAGGAG